MSSISTVVNIGNLKLKNPVMTASGTFGYGREYSEFIDLNQLGAIITKGTSLVPWKGNKPPRIAEVRGGMLNAIGLQNPGVHAFIKNDLEWLKQFDTKIIVNIVGKTIEEYVEVAQILDKTDIDGIELNLSCPNVKEGCLAFGTTFAGVKSITEKVREAYKKTLIVKLTPNVTSIEETARAAESAGADAVSMINTILGMAIDINSKSPIIGNNMGGLSGPVVKPIAIRMVYQASKAVKIPIIGLGGIMNAEDAIEFIIAGAKAIQIGTANFTEPKTTIMVKDGIEEYLRKHRVEDVNELVGSIIIN